MRRDAAAAECLECALRINPPFAKLAVGCWTSCGPRFLIGVRPSHL